MTAFFGPRRAFSQGAPFLTRVERRFPVLSSRRGTSVAVEDREDG
jgi:hypothetical protein